MEKDLSGEIHRINCLMSDIDAAYHLASVKLGVSDSTSFIFYMLYIHDGYCLLNDIYRLSGISKQTVNSALRKLESENMIYLENLNGKAKKVCATESGKPYIYEVSEKLYKAETAAFHEWSAEEIRAFIGTLEKYNALFRKQIENL